MALEERFNFRCDAPQLVGSGGSHSNIPPIVNCTLCGIWFVKNKVSVIIWAFQMIQIWIFQNTNIRSCNHMLQWRKWNPLPHTLVTIFNIWTHLHSESLTSCASPQPEKSWPRKIWLGWWKTRLSIFRKMESMKNAPVLSCWNWFFQKWMASSGWKSLLEMHCSHIHNRQAPCELECVALSLEKEERKRSKIV